MEPTKNLRILSITSLAHLMNDGTFLLFSLLIVYYTTIYHVSVVFLGTLAIVYTLLSGLLAPFFGDFADKHDKDAELMALGIFLEALSFALFSLSFSLSSLIYVLTSLAAVILGIGQAFYHPIGGAILSRVFAKRAGRALGINGAMGSVGRAIMPSIVTFLILVFAEVTGLFIVSAYMIASSLVIFFGLRSYRRGSKEEIRKPKEKLQSSFYKFLFILGSIVFIRSMFITGTSTFLGDFIYDVYLSKTLSGIFLTVGFIGSVFGQPAFGWITEKRGGRYAFVLSSIMSVVFFLLFLIFDHNLVFSSLFYTLYTFAAFSAFPVLLGYIDQIFPKSFFTVANSYIWGVGNIVGGAAGTAVITALLGMHFSLLTSFYAMFGLAIVSTVLTPLIPKKVSK